MERANRREQKNRGSRLSWRKAVLIVLAFAALLWVGNVAYEWYHLHTEMVHMQQEEIRLRQEQQELAEQKAHYNDLQAVEKEAREQLGLVKEKEVPYIR